MTILLLLLLLPLGFVLFAANWVKKGEGPKVYQPDPSQSRPGIWYCAHRARREYSFQHLYLKVTPTDQSWASRRPDVFTQRDAAGSAFFTLGAGPKDGKLSLEFNRTPDLHDPVSFEERLDVEAKEEERCIQALLDASSLYHDQVVFTTLHGIQGPGYNCNSMMAGLTRQAGMPLPKFSRRFMLCVGIGTPLPEREFFKEATEKTAA